jgi:protein required for attachment to host cells
MKRQHLWIVVADGETARFYEREGRLARFAPAMPFEMRMPNPPSREQGADAPGRAFESVGRTRHAIEPRVDRHREAKRSFARDVGEVLREKVRENAFDKLVLVAPARTMGDLRAEIDDATKQRLVGEVVKDLTHLSPTELDAWFAEGPGAELTF